VPHGVHFGCGATAHSAGLFVCESASLRVGDRIHRFGPTRKALSRIAKEGQVRRVPRAGDAAPGRARFHLIAQCRPCLRCAWRTSADQAIVRSAVSDAAANLLAFVPSLGSAKCSAFGEGVAAPRG